MLRRPSGSQTTGGRASTLPATPPARIFAYAYDLGQYEEQGYKDSMHELDRSIPLDTT